MDYGAVSLTIIIHNCDKCCVWQNGHWDVQIGGLKADADQVSFIVLESIVVSDVVVQAVFVASRVWRITATAADECH